MATDRVNFVRRSGWSPIPLPGEKREREQAKARVADLVAAIDRADTATDRREPDAVAPPRGSSPSAVAGIADPLAPSPLRLGLPTRPANDPVTLRGLARYVGDNLRRCAVELLLDEVPAADQIGRLATDLGRTVLDHLEHVEVDPPGALEVEWATNVEQRAARAAIRIALVVDPDRSASSTLRVARLPAAGFDWTAPARRYFGDGPPGAKPDAEFLDEYRAGRRHADDPRAVVDPRAPLDRPAAGGPPTPDDSDR